MDFLNINSPKFLGGSNVHALAMLALSGFIVYKLSKK
jgi:hypothetical protein